MSTSSEALAHTHVHADMLRLIAQALRNPERGAQVLDETADALDALDAQQESATSEQAAQFVVDAWSSGRRSTA